KGCAGSSPVLGTTSSPALLHLEKGAEAVEIFFAEPSDEPTVVNIELYYFNSSSSKVLMNFFEVLEKAAEAGQKITVNWIYEEEDEDSLEFGEEFAEDLSHIEFKLELKEK
ncbi:MAG: DUF1987 domain-containing protein, partial [Desulfobacteraceae bacterium]|nr:DUF1987 domain-containing protein [Desulfobacteraceae bacterium]